MRWMRSAIPIGLALLTSLAAPARAQELPPAPVESPAVVARLEAREPEAMGPRRSAWGEPFAAVQPDGGAPGARYTPAAPGASAKGMGPLEGFGFVDVLIGAANGALWGLLWSAFSDGVVAGEGASRGALAGVVTVTAIWTVFGPIH